MRIRDWRSDGCSSDLEDRLSDDRGVEHELTGAAEGGEEFRIRQQVDVVVQADELRLAGSEARELRVGEAEVHAVDGGGDDEPRDDDRGRPEIGRGWSRE